MSVRLHVLDLHTGHGAIMAPLAPKHNLRVSPLQLRRSDGHSFAGPSEDAEDLDRLVAGAAEPVRHFGVERGDLARPEHPVLVAEHETQVAGKNVDPFVAVMRPWLWDDLAGRDDDLPRLHPLGLAGQWDHRPALDVTRLKLDARITLLGRPNEVVQRHSVGVRQR